MLLKICTPMNIRKFHIKLLKSTPTLPPPPPPSPCNKCTHYKNQKCLYYKVLLGKYVYSLYDQIMDQDFATEKTAMDVYTARNDERFCGQSARHYQEENI